jgi:hypothetical protein
MKNLHWTVGTLALLAGLTHGCSGAQECTLIGWQEGLTVDVTSDEPLTPGVYRFVAEIPGETFEVDLTLEEPKNTQHGAYASGRIERDVWQVNASLAGGEFGTTGDITIGRFKGESGGPKSLSLTVLQDGAEIGALELDAIDYDEREPNGPGCGVATTARASVSISPVQ